MNEYPARDLQEAFISTFPAPVNDQTINVILSLFSNKEKYVNIYSQMYGVFSTFENLGDIQSEHPDPKKQDSFSTIFEKNLKRYPHNSNRDIEFIIYKTVMDILWKFYKVGGPGAKFFDTKSLIESGILYRIRNTTLRHSDLNFISEMVYKLLTLLVYTKEHIDSYDQFQKDIHLFRECFLDSFIKIDPNTQVYKSKDITFMNTLRSVQEKYIQIYDNISRSFESALEYIIKVSRSDDEMDKVVSKLFNLLDNVIRFDGDECKGFDMKKLVRISNSIPQDVAIDNMYYVIVFILLLFKLQRIKKGKDKFIDENETQEETQLALNNDEYLVNRLTDVYKLNEIEDNHGFGFY